LQNLNQYPPDYNFNNNNFNANQMQQQNFNQYPPNFNANNNNNFNANPIQQQNFNQSPPNFNANNNNNFNANQIQPQNFNQFTPDYIANNNNNFNANPMQFQNFNQYPPNSNINCMPMNQPNANSNFNMPPSNLTSVPMMSGGTSPFANQNNGGAPDVYNPYPNINQSYNNNVPSFDELNGNTVNQSNIPINPNAQANINNVNYVNFDQQNNNAKYFGFWGPELKKNN